MAQRLTHLITPGDHYSPLTGSAVPTVVHGLSSATPVGEASPVVVVARGTYAERYDDARIVEYDDHVPGRLAGKAMRYVDPVCGAVLGTRPAARRRSRPAVEASGQGDGVVLAHNLPQSVPLLHAAGHASALYAHNQLLGTYTSREASRALDGATAIVAVSDYLADALSERLPPRLRSRVTVVRNGVDADQFAAPERVDDGVVDVAFIGRVIPEKGSTSSSRPWSGPGVPTSG
ncbi:hypothetical protein GCM10025864_26530 [Luteimicrobium album]|uniref:Glycosyltransferase subfamily 4-like N-terminal domain-containing protein n=1 Tax=Luteimicrobium album TaxID=1054550 RepID=A0ABQ6I2A8_9MICO|nr:glycosyltransferase [Luteimicrobium album]GMA24894.1 hypothetical protein GCM10025864_26530 [Luteimicrobium album]